MVISQEIEIPQEARELIKGASTQLEEAQKFSIATSLEYAVAGENLKLIKGRMKEMDDLRKSITKPLDDSKRRVMELFRPAEDKLKQAESFVKRAMLIYQQGEQQKRIEEQRRLQEIAAAEQRRRDALAARQAEKARERGDEGRAQEILDNVPVIPIPTVVDETPKVVGVSTRTIWKFRIIDLTQIPHEYMIPDEKTIGEVARATKGKIYIPGIEIYSEEVLSSGR